jgi:hypothetical protein
LNPNRLRVVVFRDEKGAKQPIFDSQQLSSEEGEVRGGREGGREGGGEGGRKGGRDGGREGRRERERVGCRGREKE